MEKEILTYEELDDTITVKDYMKWRKCGKNVAEATFHAAGFPLLDKKPGARLRADKRAVLLYELGLTDEERKIVLKELAEKIYGGGVKCSGQ